LVKSLVKISLLILMSTAFYDAEATHFVGGYMKYE
jgi:hypothetical protein